MRPMPAAPACGLVLALAALAACAGPPSAASPSQTDPVAGLGLERIPDARVQITSETIVAAFEAQQITDLLGELPEGVDPQTEAVLCVALGMRPSGGFEITIQSAALVGGELRIRARETVPAAGRPVTQQLTYPVDCATVRRAALPVGELTVRADDTRSDEFITSAVIRVPAAEAEP